MGLLDIFKKSGRIATTNGTPTSSFMEIITGQTNKSARSPQDLLKLNTGWVEICNNKNSATCASIPFKLFYKKTEGKDLKVTPFRDINERQQKNLARQLKVNLKAQEAIVEITEHPIIDLFNNINSTMNYFDFTALVHEYLGLIGNSYVRVISKENLPYELEPLLSEYVVPVATGKNQGRINGYLYKPEDKEYKFSPEEIIHFTNYAPGNTLIGKGNLETCLSAQERYLYMDQYEKYLGINNARPDFVVGYKNKLNEKDLKDQYRQWNKRFGGVNQSGKVAVASGDFDIKNLGFAPKDMQYQVGRQWALKEIAAAYGVPEALITVQDVNRSNSAESTNHYLRYTIYPMLSRYFSKINEVLTTKYDSNIYLYFEESYLENPLEKIKNAISAYQAGIIDKNEARSNFGLEPVEIEEEPVEPVVPEEEDSEKEE